MKAAILCLLLLGLAVMLPGSGFAQTFDSTYGDVISSKSDRGDLLVRWDESGLAGPVSYTITGSDEAVYACEASGLECDSSQSTSLPFGPLNPDNGAIRQTAALEPPPPPAACGCVAGDQLVLYSVQYLNIEICDDTYGDCAPVANYSKDLCSDPKNCPAVSALVAAAGRLRRGL